MEAHKYTSKEAFADAIVDQVGAPDGRQKLVSMGFLGELWNTQIRLLSRKERLGSLR